MNLERREILQKVRAIIRAQLDDQTLEVAEQTMIDEIEDWDSVAHVQIIVAVEAEFLIRFEPDEYMDVETIGEMIDYLSRKLGHVSVNTARQRVTSLRG